MRKSRIQNIYLVRHGKSEANASKTAITDTPDFDIALTEEGREQSVESGVKLSRAISPKSTSGDFAIYWSPFQRTVSTKELSLDRLFAMSPWIKDRTRIFKEDSRLRELSWGFFNRFKADPVLHADHLKDLDKYGCPFYETSYSESGLRVCDRASSAIESMYREVDNSKVRNIIIYSHGSFLRYWLLSFFGLDIRIYDQFRNPRNCEIIHLKNNGKVDNSDMRLLDAKNANLESFPFPSQIWYRENNEDSK